VACRSVCLLDKFLKFHTVPADSNEAAMVFNKDKSKLFYIDLDDFWFVPHKEKEEIFEFT
jgi:hypothetical protein